MADSKIRKVVIPKEKLPAFNGVNHSYTVRYRIVSEDRNRTSHWSPQYKLAADDAPDTDYSLSIDTAGKVLNLVWAQPEGLNSLFDIYVKWGDQPWKYLSQEVSTKFTTLIPTGTTQLQVAVQVPTFPRERFSRATLFETEVESVVV